MNALHQKIKAVVWFVLLSTIHVWGYTNQLPVEISLAGGTNPDGFSVQSAILTISNLVSGFSTTNNYLPANLGQIKYIAAPFYDRLNELNMTNAWPEGATPGQYPWSGSPHAPQDFSIANIGQLKYLFSFDPD